MSGECNLCGEMGHAELSCPDMTGMLRAMAHSGMQSAELLTAAADTLEANASEIAQADETIKRLREENHRLASDVGQLKRRLMDQR